MAAIKMPISNVKLLFYPPFEVKCGLENSVSTKCSSLTKLEKWMSMYENDTKLCNQYLTMVNLWWMQIKMWTKSWGRLPTFLLVRGSGPNVVYARSIFFFFFFFGEKYEYMQDILTKGQEKWRFWLCVSED